MFEEGTMLLLHHVGARSGVERVHPLGYFTIGDRIFIVASFGGSDVNPAWYNNLLANPRTTVEIGPDRSFNLNKLWYVDGSRRASTSLPAERICRSDE